MFDAITCQRLWDYPGFVIRIIEVSDHPSQTRLFHSGGSMRSRSASELLLTQKTSLQQINLLRKTTDAT
jgi:hypothetical protein